MDLTLFVPIVLLVVMFIFLFWTTKKNQKKLMDMRSKLKVGVGVMLQSGIYGTITDYKENEGIAVVESTPGVLLRVHANSIATIEEKA